MKVSKQEMTSSGEIDSIIKRKRTRGELVGLLSQYAVLSEQYNSRHAQETSNIVVFNESINASTELKRSSDFSGFWTFADLCTFATSVEEEKEGVYDIYVLPSTSKYGRPSLRIEKDERVQEPSDAKIFQKTTINELQDMFRMEDIDWTSPELYAGPLAKECKRKFCIMANINFTKWKPQWQLKTEKNGVKVYGATIPGSCWAAVKSHSVIKNASMKALRDFLLDDNNIPLYDTSFDKFQVLIKTSKFSVRRYKYKAIFPTSARDFLIVTVSGSLPDGGFYMCSISPDDSLCPADSSYVRAKIMCSGAVIRPTTDGSTLTLYGHSDLGGFVPASLLNMVQYNLPVKTQLAIQDHFLRKR